MNAGKIEGIQPCDSSYCASLIYNPVPLNGFVVVVTAPGLENYLIVDVGNVLWKEWPVTRASQVFRFGRSSEVSNLCMVYIPKKQVRKVHTA